MAFDLAKDFVPAILIIGHFSNFWTMAPGRGTKYFSSPRPSPQLFCLALPFNIYLVFIPSWKHSMTPSCPAEWGFLLFCLTISRALFCPTPHHLLLQSLYFLICFVLDSELLEGRYWGSFHLKCLLGIGMSLLTLTLPSTGINSPQVLNVTL